ncbi:thiamine/thiamine pyrophosphate ABC transporter permease ThiP [Pseudooceanicola sp. 502str34]
MHATRGETQAADQFPARRRWTATAPTHGPGALAGRLAAGAVCLALVLPLAAILWRAATDTPGPASVMGLFRLGPADLAALRFTLWQALLSALISTLLAVPVARALARRRFPGRGFVITLMGAPFLLPVIVAVLALLAVFGRGGLVNEGLTALGLPAIRIYGLHGVVLAHVFFNLPLAVRLILQGWQAIPAERFRLAAQLGLRPAGVFRLLEAPMLRATLPGTALVIFAICLSSFAVALTLGGGPAATTVELAIYQSFRFDFDLTRAATLALIQLALVAGAALISLRIGRPAGFGSGLDRPVTRWDAGSLPLRLIDGAAIALAAAFLLVPLAVIVLNGIGGLTRLPASLWPATLNSLVVSLAATATTMALALAMALARRTWVETAGLLPLAVSGLVLGTGLFLLVLPFAAPATLALPVTVLVNTLMALPFALRILAPVAAKIEAEHGRLADHLGLTGLARLRLLTLPRLRPALGFAAGLTAALAMGDLGVIALFADPQQATLPLQMHRLMGAYQMQAAQGAALVLLALSFGLFWIFDRWGRAGAEA